MNTPLRCGTNQALAVLATALAICLSGPPAQAETSLAVPGDFASLGEAVAAARPGQVIRLAKGRYEEHVLVEAPGITIEGEAVLAAPSAQRPVLHVKGVEGVTLRGLTIEGGRGLLIEGGQGHRLERLLIRRPVGHGVRIYDSAASLSDVTIEDISSPPALAQVDPKPTGLDVGRSKVRANSITIRRSEQTGMAIRGGPSQVEMTDVRVIDTAYGGIGLRGAGVEASLENVTVERATGAGVFVAGDARIGLRNLMVQATRPNQAGNAMGIFVKGARLELDGGRLTELAGVGIMLSKDAKAVISGVEVGRVSVKTHEGTTYGGNGIEVDNATSVQISESRLFENANAGLAVFRAAWREATPGASVNRYRVTVRASRLERNEKYGINVADSSAASATDNEIAATTGMGILVSGQSELLAVANRITGTRAPEPDGLARGVMIRQGSRAELRENLVKDNQGIGIHVLDSTAEIIANKVLGTLPSAKEGVQRDGITVGQNASARIVANEIAGNSHIGVRVLEADRAEISKNRFRGNGEREVEVWRSGAREDQAPGPWARYGVRVSNNRFEDCGDTAIFVSEQSAVAAAGNEIMRCGALGIFANKGADLYALGNRIVATRTREGSGYSRGIAVESEARAQIVDNLLVSNRGAAIHVFDRAHAEVVGNRIYLTGPSGEPGHGGRGLVVNKDASATIAGNDIAWNQQMGISVQDGAKAELRANTIRGNGDGVFIERDCSATMHGNAIEGNLRFGIVIKKSTVTLSDNRSAFNQYFGLSIDPGSTAEAHGNEILLNGGGGIMVTGATATLANNLIAGSYPAVVDRTLHAGGIGLFAQEASSVAARYNTFIANAAAAFDIGTADKHVVLEGNVLAHNGQPPILARDPAKISGRDNLFAGAGKEMRALRFRLRRLPLPAPGADGGTFIAHAGGSEGTAAYTLWQEGVPLAIGTSGRPKSLSAGRYRLRGLGAETAVEIKAGRDTRLALGSLAPVFAGEPAPVAIHPLGRGASLFWASQNTAGKGGSMLLPGRYRIDIAGASVETTTQAGRTQRLAFGRLPGALSKGANWRLVFQDGRAVRALERDGKVVGPDLLATVPADTYEWWDVFEDGRIETGEIAIKGP